MHCSVNSRYNWTVSEAHCCILWIIVNSCIAHGKYVHYCCYVLYERSTANLSVWRKNGIMKVFFLMWKFTYLRELKVRAFTSYMNIISLIVACITIAVFEQTDLMWFWCIRITCPDQCPGWSIALGWDGVGFSLAVQKMNTRGYPYLTLVCVNRKFTFPNGCS